MSTQSSNQSAFTLVEMLVVLVLLGFAAAISLPYAKGSGQQQKLEATALQLAALFRKAQVQAYMTNAAVEVKFDRDTRVWRSGAAVRMLEVDPSVTVTVLSIEGQVSDKAFGFKFLPTGGNTGGGVVLNVDRASVEVNLNWLTGAITTRSMGATP